MTWVRQREKPGHRCNTPFNTWGTPIGSVEDLWRCDECGIVWKIKMVRVRITRMGETVKSRRRQKAWVVANWLTQVRHGGLPKEEVTKLEVHRD